MNPTCTFVPSLKMARGTVISEETNSQKLHFVLSDIQKLISSKWDVYVFGSAATGLASSSSDVDLFIDQNNCYFKSMTVRDKVNNWRDLLLFFLTTHGIKSDVFELYDAVLESRVPILRLIHVPTKTKVDISSANGLAVENSHLVRAFINSDQRVKWLVVNVLALLRRFGLVGDAPKFRPYAVTWLVLFFLMRTSPPVLCPVVDLQVGKERCDVGDWDCRLPSCLPETKNKQSNIELLTNFMDFVTSLDFGDYVICPLVGKLISRATFKAPHLLSSTFTPYKKKLYNSPKKGLKLGTAICLQDPLELDHNITKCVDTSMVFRLVSFCALSKQILDTSE